MIRQTIKKSDYAPISVSGGKLRLMWDRVDVIEREYQLDEEGNIVFDENKEPVVLSEKETDLCTCNVEETSSARTMKSVAMLIDKGVGKSYNAPTMKDWQTWAKTTVGDYDKRLSFLKERLGIKIDEYGSGTYDVYGENAVDDFTIGGVHLWFDTTMRTKVRENLESCEKDGLAETVLRFGGMEFPTTVENGWAMYYAVLSYARRCWNTCEEHHVNKAILDSEDDVVNYDFTAGYPEKLSF